MLHHISLGVREMTELELYRKDIAQGGGTTAAVDALIEQVVGAHAHAELEPLLQHLEIEASKLDWLRDSDYAAVALQVAAPRALSWDVRCRLLSFALARARWCAGCA